MLTVDRAARTISGRAVPYDTVAQPRLALPRRFPFGSLTWTMPWDIKLLIDHNKALCVGRAIALEDLNTGLWATFKVSWGERGDRALEMAAATHRGLSIGLEDDETRLTPDGILECVRARIVEISLTKDPVFS